MVMVNMLTMVAHFILVKSIYSTSVVALVLIKEIVRLHDVVKNIVLERDGKFTSRFWKELFVSFRIEFPFSTIYHLQRDGNTGRVTIILEDMLAMHVMYH